MLKSNTVVSVRLGALQPSSSAKASFERNKGKGSCSIRHESKQKDGTETILSRDWQCCSFEDLSNISLCTRKGMSRNDLNATVQVLTEKYGMIDN